MLFFGPVAQSGVPAGFPRSFAGGLEGEIFRAQTLMTGVSQWPPAAGEPWASPAK
jgi:hypothetical protein